MIYARISTSPDGEASLGVQRQEADCRELAAHKGWTVAEVLVDDDVSAYKPGKRPAYARLIEGIRAHRYDALIVYDLDRLHRHPWELEEFFRICDGAGFETLASVAGDHNLATADGQFHARIMGAVAKKESDDKSRRLRRKHAEIAEQGRFPGGKAPYGYRSPARGALAIEVDEAAIIGECARRVLAGESLRSIALDLTERDVPGPHPGPWRPSGVARILTQPAPAGRRHVPRSADTTAANWPAILDEVTWHRLRALVKRPGRAGSTARRWLLTGGISVCGICHQPLSAKAVARLGGRPWYQCVPPPAGDGCGRLSVVGEPFERHVTDELFIWEQGTHLGEAAERIGAPNEGTHHAIADIESQMGELAALWSTKRISMGEWLSARDPLQARLDAARSVDAADHVAAVLAPFKGGHVLAEEWHGLDLSQRRAIAAALIETITVAPGRVGLNRFDPSRISLEWR